ncbi:HRDC domain-containing protein [Corynebacterium sp. H78]|uniref:HRDC domain-containing protein n=1 Tax=Corynebacterium sp. H78 TaxID=3133417 RepID=UPI003099BF57
MYPVLTTPADGTPQVLTSPRDIAAAGAVLANGYGPLAVDTERASAFRYDDRAFLLQFRRQGAGTFLIDPESIPGCTDCLPAQLNDLTWIIHAAHSDLPALRELGLYPANLIDTEIAGRLAGFPKVGLASLTEELLSISLAKGHGQEDWSSRPLPSDWLDYAALDVELLIELANSLTDVLVELDRYSWLVEECEAVRLAFSPDNVVPLADDDRWRQLRGVGKLRRPEQLVVAKALWNQRDQIARQRDVSPTSVLPHQVIIALAEHPARTKGDIIKTRGFPRKRRGAVDQWFAVVQDALATPKRQWPRQVRQKTIGRPHHKHWPECAPRAQRCWEALQAAHQNLADDLGIRPDTIFKPSDLRDVAWAFGGCGNKPVPTHADEVRELLATFNARPWQIELMTGLIAETVLLPRRQPLP